MSHEIRGYLNNIIVFLRMHRAVADGVTPLGSRHLNALSKALAPLHGLSYISPSLVQLATRKVYPHRIVITAPECERSLQWGSSVEAVREMLAEVTVEDIIEEVLEAVEVPLWAHVDLTQLILCRYNFACCNMTGFILCIGYASSGTTLVKTWLNQSNNDLRHFVKENSCSPKEFGEVIPKGNAKEQDWDIWIAFGGVDRSVHAPLPFL
jgi:hypothetical protein